LDPFLRGWQFTRCLQGLYTGYGRHSQKGVRTIVIDIETSHLLETEIRQLMIAQEDVACVQLDNSLEHALLVLIKSGYSSIPVLDPASRVQGVISKTVILDSILGLERIEFERLSERTVADVLVTKVPAIKASETFFRSLELSINQPFLCVEDDNGLFLGILTRKSILALVYRYLKSVGRTHPNKRQ
jgi:predicted transcriptional regulator